MARSQWLRCSARPSSRSLRTPRCAATSGRTNGTPDESPEGAGGLPRAAGSAILTAMESRAFHYAFLVRDLDETRRFYVELLGCREGRSAATWVDLELFGNQLSCHLGTPPAPASCGQVDGISVPMPHFGAVVSFDEYERLAAR